ncbi:HAD-like domain-containing protein, partial [Gymnopilus junonius]
MAQIKALIFDVFGTTVDWRTTIVAELEALGKKYDIPSGTDWNKFAQRWRNDFLSNSKRIASGGAGTSNIDTSHRQLLDQLLKSPEWSHIGIKLDDPARQDLVLGWHRLHGWPDVVSGLQSLKKQTIIVGLSNGSLRALIDLAKNAALPWDAILSTDFFSTFKPNPKVYS